MEKMAEDFSRADLNKSQSQDVAKIMRFLFLSNRMGSSQTKVICEKLGRYIDENLDNMTGNTILILQEVSRLVE